MRQGRIQPGQLRTRVAQHARDQVCALPVGLHGLPLAAVLCLRGLPAPGAFGALAIRKVPLEAGAIRQPVPALPCTCACAAQLGSVPGRAHSACSSVTPCSPPQQQQQQQLGKGCCACPGQAAWLQCQGSCQPGGRASALRLPSAHRACSHGATRPRTRPRRGSPGAPSPGACRTQSRPGTERRSRRRPGPPCAAPGRVLWQGEHCRQAGALVVVGSAVGSTVLARRQPVWRGCRPHACDMARPAVLGVGLRSQRSLVQQSWAELGFRDAAVTRDRQAWAHPCASSCCQLPL